MVNQLLVTQTSCVLKFSRSRFPFKLCPQSKNLILRIYNILYSCNTQCITPLKLSEIIEYHGWNIGRPIIVAVLPLMQIYIMNALLCRDLLIQAISLGGGIALRYTTRFPERIGRLILVCSAGNYKTFHFDKVSSLPLSLPKRPR